MIDDDDIFLGHGVEIILNNPQDFLKVAETLTRLGIPSYKDVKTLYQSCHILHKRGRYAIVHFKSMFALDGRETTISVEDLARRDNIVRLLVDWNLCTYAIAQEKPTEEVPFSRVKVIKYSEKHDWKLESKYSIGTRHYEQY